MAFVGRRAGKAGLTRDGRASLGPARMAKYAYHRLDGNHPAIVEALERLGATVYPIGRPVDLLVGWKGQNWLLEVKQPRAGLEPRQVTFFIHWAGQAAVVRSVEDALQVIGAR